VKKKIMRRQIIIKNKFSSHTADTPQVNPESTKSKKKHRYLKAALLSSETDSHHGDGTILFVGKEPPHKTPRILNFGTGRRQSASPSDRI
jgi:hypothetical protein